MAINLRELIEAYANEVSNWGYYDDRGDDKRLAESLASLAVRSRSLDVQLAVAEAALAYVEYQASNPSAEAGEYFREQCRLWDAFIAARDKAKAANQS